MIEILAPYKRQIKTLFGVFASLAGFVILYLLIKKAGLSSLLNTFIQLSPVYLILGIFFWIIALLVGTYRFKKFCDIKIPFLKLYNIYLYGTILNYASAVQGLGIGAKVGLLKLNQVKVSKSTASISLEIIYDILFAGLIFLVFLLKYHDQLGSKVAGAYKLIILGICIGVVIIVSLILFRRNNFIRDFVEHLIEAFKVRQAIYNFLITATIWILGGLLMYFLVLATGSYISFQNILFATTAAFVLGLISFVPGGLGVRDAISAFVLHMSGLEAEMSIAISLINRIVSICTVLVIIMMINLSKKLIPEKVKEFT